MNAGHIFAIAYTNAHTDEETLKTRTDGNVFSSWRCDPRGFIALSPLKALMQKIMSSARWNESLKKYYGLMNATHYGLSIRLIADSSVIPLPATIMAYAIRHRLCATLPGIQDCFSTTFDVEKYNREGEPK